MEQLQQTKQVNFFEQQYNAFNFTTQFGAVVAGVQSGKTFMGSHWGGKKIQEFSGKNGLIVAPSYKVLQQSTLDKFFSEYPVLRKYYKEQKGVIELPTGGKVFIRSADQPLLLEGMTINWAWLDEAGMASRLLWTVIRSRVSFTGGQVLITTTPYNLGWLYQEVYLPWKEKKVNDVSVFTWRSIDNPFYPKGFYDSERARLSPEEFARRYMGEFRKMEGLVYDISNAQIIPYNENIIGRARFIGAGIDWGFTNPAAIAVCAYLDGKWYIVGEWYETGKTTAEIIQVAREMMRKYNIRMFYPDPAEPDRIQECQNAKMPIAETKKDITGGISRIKQLIKEEKFYVFDTCRNWLDEAENYHYPEGLEGKPFKEEPVALQNHLMDATRYIIDSYLPVHDGFVQTKQSGGLKPFYPSLGF